MEKSFSTATAAAESADGVVVLTLTGPLDGAELLPRTRMARDLLRAPGVHLLVVDIGAIDFVDSSGLGLLVELRQLADDRGAGFVLRSVPRRVSRLLQLTGLLDHLPAE